MTPPETALPEDVRQALENHLLSSIASMKVQSELARLLERESTRHRERARIIDDVLDVLDEMQRGSPSKSTKPETLAETIRAVLQADKAEVTRLTTALQEAKGCPHDGDNCACAIGSRHFWFDAYCGYREHVKFLNNRLSTAAVAAEKVESNHATSRASVQETVDEMRSLAHGANAASPMVPLSLVKQWADKLASLFPEEQ